MPQLTGYDKFIQQALKYGFSLWGPPKTGQTTVYKANDDATFQKGYPRSGARFTDNGNGTITDNATGLMWVKEPGAIGGNFGSAGSPAKMTWPNAIDECIALTYAGHSDWRLPNPMESVTIVNWGKKLPSAYTTTFPNTQSSTYKSSSTYLQHTGYSWCVNYTYGTIGARLKTDTDYVRPVRLGMPAV